MSPKGIEVVLPRRVAMIEATGFLLKHASWVERQLLKLEQRASRLFDYRLRHPDSIMFHGTPTNVGIIEDATAHRFGIVELAADGIQVRVPPAGIAGALGALENGLRRFARHEIGLRLAVRAKEMNISFGRVLIMNQRTRWGSCSSLKNLSFNWRLIQAPPEALDYVVVHELAHLAELNHSSRFWRIVRTHCPEFVRWKKWLIENESLLGIHGPLEEEGTA